MYLPLLEAKPLLLVSPIGIPGLSVAGLGGSESVSEDTMLRDMGGEITGPASVVSLVTSSWSGDKVMLGTCSVCSSGSGGGQLGNSRSERYVDV